MNKFYVYTLSYLDGTVFYVGKGTAYRIGRHFQQAKRGVVSHKCATIRKIWAAGGEVVTTKVATGLTNEEAINLEIQMIEEIGIDNLTNQTCGGEGSVGRSLSDEQKQYLSELNKGKPNPRKGTIHVPNKRNGGLERKIRSPFTNSSKGDVVFSNKKVYLVSRVHKPTATDKKIEEFAKLVGLINVI